MSGLAGKLGLGQEAVEVRHQSTHGALPALPLLLDVAHTAIQWLHKHYWTPQLQQIRKHARQQQSQPHNGLNPLHLTSYRWKFIPCISAYYESGN